VTHLRRPPWASCCRVARRRLACGASSPHTRWTSPTSARCSALAGWSSASGSLCGVEWVDPLDEGRELGDCEVELGVDSAVDESVLEQAVAADGGGFDGESHACGDV
jgi:hypothetical protein